MSCVGLSGGVYDKGRGVGQLVCAGSVDCGKKTKEKALRRGRREHREDEPKSTDPSKLPFQIGANRVKEPPHSI